MSVSAGVCMLLLQMIFIWVVVKLWSLLGSRIQYGTQYLGYPKRDPHCATTTACLWYSQLQASAANLHRLLQHVSLSFSSCGARAHSRNPTPPYGTLVDPLKETLESY